MKKLILITVTFLILTGCSDEPKQTVKANFGDIENYEIIADTIITDVVIKNPDNDEWTDYCLRTLNKTELVNHIFNAVYEGKLTPYNYFNNIPLTINDIKNLEKDPEFNRNNIAKVQYQEAWHYNVQKQTMIKKVHSIMFAFEVYNNEGEIKGYKPAFKVYFDDQENGQ